VTLGSRRTWLLAIVVFLAALAGVLIGRSISDQRPQQPNALHDLLHDELNLDARQLAQIEDVERRFAIRRRELELWPPRDCRDRPLAPSDG
jgi:nickel and cobalt resistance protein CnrR